MAPLVLHTRAFPSTAARLNFKIVYRSCGQTRGNEHEQAAFYKTQMFASFSVFPFCLHRNNEQFAALLDSTGVVQESLDPELELAELKPLVRKISGLALVFWLCMLQDA